MASLIDALASVRLEITDVAAVVLSHLHFDHCGQQGTLDAPVYVQAAEHGAAQTPGHTPGHQSVVIEAGDDRVVLAAQCAHRAGEVRSGQPAATNLHDPSWPDAATDSLDRIRSLAPVVVHLSHDPELVSIR